MKKLVTFASEIRLSALVCSSIAVLLTACGGGTADQGNSAQASQNLAMVSSVDATTGASAPAVMAAAQLQQDGSAASAQAGNGASVAMATPAQGEFALAGYGAASASEQNPNVAGSSLIVSDSSTMQLATVSATAPAPSLATTPATTYNYYLSPTGNDNNSGTSSAPWRTFVRAAKAARAGTTFWVAPGTYAGGFKTTVSGTASARIYWVSTTRWGAKIVPPASSLNNIAWDSRGSYNDIIGFDVDGTSSQSGTKWTHGIYSAGSYDMIRNNHVHNIATSVTCTSAGASAIGVDSYYYGVNTDVLSNLVNDIGPAGCRYDQGIYISTSGTVKNNVVYRVAEAGIHLWHDAHNVIISNNTVTTSDTGIIVGAGDYYHTTGPDDYTMVYNNIVFDNKMGVSEQGKTGTHNQYRNNLVYQNPTYNWSLKNGLTNYNTVASNPLFIGYSRTGSPNLRISTSSPAVGRGTSSYAYATDFLDRPRNSTTGYDIGAYQH